MRLGSGLADGMAGWMDGWLIRVFEMIHVGIQDIVYKCSSCVAG